MLTLIGQVVSRYSALIWALLKPLGSWGVFAIAGIDSAFFGLPLDPVVAGYVYQDHHRLVLYALMAAAGSAAGCIILYVIGVKGGEVVLRKRISRTRFDQIRGSFDRHEFWALMVPSMIPPPFPFKLFVLAASAFEMNFWHFLLAIFAGRLIRFLLLSLLVVRFGPQIVLLLSAPLSRHWAALVGVAALFAVAVIWTWYRLRVRTAK